jgi:hypothetical protein
LMRAAIDLRFKFASRDRISGEVNRVLHLQPLGQFA